MQELKVYLRHVTGGEVVDAYAPTRAQEGVRVNGGRMAATIKRGLSKNNQALATKVSKPRANI